MFERDIIIVGGGAAGVFAAIATAERNRRARVSVLEQGPEFLSKVRISGGGRCNVTHACFEPRELSNFYPRGGKALLGPFSRFQPRDTVDWFQQRGVKLKVEPDGRMFPITDSSRTIIECLLGATDKAGIEMIPRCGVTQVSKVPGGFELRTTDGRTMRSKQLMLATGGCRGVDAGKVAASLGHSIVPPVPSLFAFTIRNAWLNGLAGVSLQEVAIQIPDTRLAATGALVITHAGLSGPAILKLSAWGARELNRRDYAFPVKVNWLAGARPVEIDQELESRRSSQGAKLILNGPISPIPARLWEALVRQAEVARDVRWSALSRPTREKLISTLTATELQVHGKSLNKDEFVTCGGVNLDEVNFKTMESRRCAGLFFGGELLDIDGLTGGFNFQAAWTTGWLAGLAMAAACESPDGSSPE